MLHARQERVFTMTDTPQLFPLSTAEERRTALEAWAQQNPFATLAAAYDYLRSKFGQAISTKTASEVMKAAREAAQKKLTEMNSDTAPPLDTSPPPMEIAPVPETVFPPRPSDAPSGGFSIVDMILQAAQNMPRLQLVPVAIKLLRMAGIHQLQIVNDRETLVDGTTIVA